MMKCLLAVVLLHLCCSVKSNMSLNSEIRRRLNTLNDLYKRGDFTLEYPIKVPSRHMKNNTSDCKGVFIRELKNLLNNVTVHKRNEHILRELDANLSLGNYPENDEMCKMDKSYQSNSHMPFKQYTIFLQKLNREN